MWDKLSSIILRNRIVVLIAVGLITIFMGYYAQDAKMSYKLAQVLPKSDSTFQQYEYFKSIFGKEGSMLVIGTADPNLNQLKNFNAWYDLTHNLDTIKGVQNVLSIANLYDLKKDVVHKKFKLYKLVKEKPKTQQAVDSILNKIHSLPFYEGYLFNKKNDATLIAVNLDRKIFNSDLRKPLFNKIEKVIKHFKANSDIKDLHVSGLPLIRENSTTKVAYEVKLFCILAALVTALILLFFFRSFYAMLYSMIAVGIGIVWCLGFIGMIGYPITLLTGLMPPLIIVIGIPNCIYIINQYQQEYRNHGNQIKAIQRAIAKMGGAIFLINLTLAIGLGAFIFASSTIMIQFGIVATVSVLMLFILAISLVPSIYSFMKPPKLRHSKHLEEGWAVKVIKVLTQVISKHRTKVYIASIVLILLGIYGATLIRTSGKISDDIPKNDKVYKDLQFFQTNFNGVLPLEIMVDLGKPKAVNKQYNLKKINQLQKLLRSYPALSKPISIVEGLKFLKQSFYNGDPKQYQLITNSERAFFAPYLRNVKGENDLLKNFVDSTGQMVRISTRMADIGTDNMNHLLKRLRPEIDSIFNPEKYKVILTGTSMVFFKGTNYLIENLFLSVAIAIFSISLLMAFLFRSTRMVIIALIPNIIPLITTAGLMGYLGIPLKPSTIIVFSVAFGISIDPTIRYLTWYKRGIEQEGLNIVQSVYISLKEAGISMMYTSIVLFFGFGVFIASDFGGTKALGMLTSFTLLIAMLCNMILLPTLLLTLDNTLNTKSAKKEPYMEVLDEEEDIDSEALKIEKLKKRNKDS